MFFDGRCGMAPTLLTNITFDATQPVLDITKACCVLLLLFSSAPCALPGHVHWEGLHGLFPRVNVQVLEQLGAPSGRRRLLGNGQTLYAEFLFNFTKPGALPV